MTKIGQKRTTPKKAIKGKRNIKLTPLDIMFSKIVRSGGVCEYCGEKRKVLHCSHFIGRRYRNTRWLLDNASCLCYTCHNHMHEFPGDHTDFFIKRLGPDRVEQLGILARSGNKVDLDAIKKELQGKLRILEGA